MPSNRELMELAAKAAGETIVRWFKDKNGVECAVLENGNKWQPLQCNSMTDCDGDALRLASRLKIDVHQFFNNVAATPAGFAVRHQDRVPCSGDGDDRAAALRLGIVWAAAQMASHDA